MFEISSFELFYGTRSFKRLTHKLYEHLYAHYEEMEEINDMTDESLMLDIDIIEKQHEEDIATIVADKDRTITALQEEITLLKEQLDRLKA